jgi:hypothetical protein
VRLLQNNERGFPFIFAITVAEYDIRTLNPEANIATDPKQSSSLKNNKSNFW